MELSLTATGRLFSARHHAHVGPSNTTAGESFGTQHVLLGLGSGVGPGDGGLSSGPFYSGDAGWRRRVQAVAVFVCLVVGYAMALLFLASHAYHQAASASRVAFYANPQRYTYRRDAESFLRAFGYPPASARLFVAGLRPSSRSFCSRHQAPSPDFAFSLDLSPWVVPTGGASLESCIVPEDYEQLKTFLAQDCNDLAEVRLCKEVSWTGWEELATNTKQVMRQRGYKGTTLSVRLEGSEVLHVYKNKRWAHFMHSTTFHAVLLLSFVGWFLYLPYIWYRSRALRVRLRYHVDMPISAYWRLVADRLTAEGFEASPPSGLTREQPLTRG